MANGRSEATIYIPLHFTQFHSIRQQSGECVCMQVTGRRNGENKRIAENTETEYAMPHIRIHFWGHYVLTLRPFLRLCLSFILSSLLHNNRFHKILLLGLGTNLFLLFTSKLSSDGECVRCACVYVCGGVV